MPIEVSASEDELADAAVSELYVEHARSLRNALLRLTWPGCDVDDLLHEAFLVALRRRRAFLSAASHRGWLYGVVVKVASHARRKHRLWRFLGLEAAEAVAVLPGGADEKLDAVARVEAALARLSPKKRQVLVLFELEGLTGEEIAVALGCPPATVFTRLHHARKDLEHLMVTP